MTTPNWQRILTTTDLSPFASKAVAYAHGLAEKFGAELHVLHVVDSADKAAAQHAVAGTYDPADAADPQTAWLGELLGESGTIRRVEAVQIGKDVAEKIVQYAEKHDIDLIVLASHGRTGVAHFWLGSVAEKVIRSSRSPVLVLRPSPDEFAKRPS